MKVEVIWLCLFCQLKYLFIASWTSRAWTNLTEELPALLSQESWKKHLEFINLNDFLGFNVQFSFVINCIRKKVLQEEWINIISHAPWKKIEWISSFIYFTLFSFEILKSLSMPIFFGLCLETDFQKQGYFCLTTRISQAVNTPINLDSLSYLV